MQERIYRELAPLLRRQAISWTIRGAVWGLLIGAIAGTALGAWRFLDGPIAPFQALLVPACGAIIGALFGYAIRPRPHAAAVAIDSHYKLKDRSVTALDFLNKPASPVFELQIADAEARLKTVEADKVAPWRLPRPLPVAVAVLLATVVLAVWPLRPKTVQAGLPPAPEAIVAEADKVKEDLKQLDQVAKKEKNKELQKLVQKLKELADEMKLPGTDVKEALAKLSEMQAAIAAEQAQYNVSLVDAKLQSLGEAMSSAEALESISEALENGQYDKAAEQLEALDQPKLDRKEKKATKEKLKKAAKEMKDAGLGQLSDAASEMADGLDNEDASECKSAGKKLGGLCRSQSSRKKLNSLLAAECDKLGECKSNCNKNGGKLTKKLTTPKSTWGRGSYEDFYGEKTALDAKRDRKEITGKAGEGPSEKETTHSPEGRQTAAVAYQEMYKKAKKAAEAALDGEPIPLGHRQTIRRYFELIRPQDKDMDALESAPKGDKPAK